ncbi:MAG: DnaD domain protein [Oscillospiraceae bacterium]|nr:DnaD domain protein [Oscillospiraceae bacterium]
MTDKEALLPLPTGAADRLIAAHDGDVALLYLYMLRTGGLDAEGAAGALCRTAREIEAAAEKLRRMGLSGSLPAPDPERLLPDSKLPEYEAADLARFAAEDPTLQTVYAEAAQIFGRKLSPADMKMLAGLYKHLGLPAEVLLLLLHYCAERAQLKKPGAVPSPRNVEKEGYDWANREIMTLEQAEEYIRFRREQRELTAQVREVLSIRGRELGKTEREYIERWLSLGFRPEAIAIAYDRTLVNTGRLQWSYMDRIIRSWHEKKLHTPAEIEAGDGRRPAGGGQQPGAAVDIRELKDIYSKI